MGWLQDAWSDIKAILAFFAGLYTKFKADDLATAKRKAEQLADHLAIRKDVYDLPDGAALDELRKPPE